MRKNPKKESQEGNLESFWGNRQDPCWWMTADLTSTSMHMVKCPTKTQKVWSLRPPNSWWDCVKQRGKWQNSWLKVKGMSATCISSCRELLRAGFAENLSVKYEKFHLLSELDRLCALSLQRQENQEQLQREREHTDVWIHDLERRHECEKHFLERRFVL